MRLALSTAALGTALVLATTACDSNEREPLSCTELAADCDLSAVPSYANQIAPIIQSRCAGCHTAADPGGPWPFDDLEEVGDWSFSIVAALGDCSMPPPDSDVRISDGERQLLNAWLVCGAPPN